MAHLILGDSIPSADLLVQGVKQLLSSCGSGVGGSVLQSSAKASERKQALVGSIERNSHAIKEIYNRRSALGHSHNRRLVVEEVATGNRVFKVKIRRVAFASKVDRTVNAALGAHRV